MKQFKKEHYEKLFELEEEKPEPVESPDTHDQIEEDDLHDINTNW